MRGRLLKVLLFAPALGALLLVSCGESPRPDTHGAQGTAVADSGSTKVVECCIKPSCEVCVEKFGKCTCLADLKAGKPICGECIHGYKEGKGKLKLIAIPELKKREGT